MPKTPQPPKPRASDQVEAELRRLILTLELEPGLALSESALMKRYNWGRTPLREAFSTPFRSRACSEHSPSTGPSSPRLTCRFC